MTVKNIQFTPLEIRIVKFLFKHYQEKYNARQLAQVLRINHAHAHILCAALAWKNLLRKENRGNAVYFSFWYENELALKFMEYLLSLEEKSFPKWLLVASHSLKKFVPFLKIGLVFGSSLRDKEHGDIDVLLVYNPAKTKEINRVKEEIRISGLLEKPLRYVDITEKDIFPNRKNKIFYQILSENLVFHNPQKYGEVIRKCHKSMNT